MKNQGVNIEKLRKLVMRSYIFALFLCVAIVAVIAVTFSLYKAIVVALAFYPGLTAAWFFSTQDIVHGQKFREMSRTGQINTVLRVAGIVMSVAAFAYALPTLFEVY